MSAKLFAEEHYLGSNPSDRKIGREVLDCLQSVRSQDPLAEVLLRAHAFHLGIPGITSLSEIPVESLEQPWVYLQSTMSRHSTQDYFLPLPNVWIDLDPSWHRRLLRMLSDSLFAHDTFKEWGICPPSRHRDHGHWLLRVLEASLLDAPRSSLLLAGIANFRRDAALPSVVSTTGPFLSAHRSAKEKRGKSNALRSALRQQRKPGGANSDHIPDFDTLSQLDDPISRLVSLLLRTRLNEPSKTNRSLLREERNSRAQSEIMAAVTAMEQKSATPLLREAWRTIGTYWPRLAQHFSADETAFIQHLITLPLETVFSRQHQTNAGAFNLIPPSLALTHYMRPAQLETESLKDSVIWGYLTLLCRCGCRASDLYRINARSFNGIGSSEMCVTLPFTKTTDRRTLPVGVTLPGSELQQFSVLLELLRYASKEDQSWFSIITGKAAPERWQYDFAYSDFRRAIAPDGTDYLPTHIPRHAFATAFGLHNCGQILGGLDRTFFRCWTRDALVQAINDSAIPRIHASLHDSLLLANQIMGHKTPEEFVSTYCHAWPLILAAMAEVRLPNCLPWARLESMQYQATD